MRQKFKTVDGTRIVSVLIALVLTLAVATLAGFYFYWQQVEKNREVITKVDALNDQLAEDAYAECVQRNTRSEEATKQLKKLVDAHTSDGSENARRVWAGYLKELQAHPLPPCIKPNGDL